MRYLPLLLLVLTAPVQAEPGNAPDTKGRFVLVVAGTATDTIFSDGWTVAHNEQHRIQPFTIPGFTSFYACRGAGLELQARLNTDGYTLDFACIATGR